MMDVMDKKAFEACSKEMLDQYYVPFVNLLVLLLNMDDIEAYKVKIFSFDGLLGKFVHSYGLTMMM